jgi:hypothetical protein
MMFYLYLERSSRADALREPWFYITRAGADVGEVWFHAPWFSARLGRR